MTLLKKNYNYCVVKLHPQGSTLVEWKLTARDIKPQTSCNVGVMARYNYTTYSSTSVKFINEEELRRLRDEGKSVSETGELSIGEGPVKPYVEVLNQPIAIDPVATTPEGVGTGIMSFWLENKGSGSIKLKEPEKGNVIFARPRNDDVMFINVKSQASSASASVPGIVVMMNGSGATLSKSLMSNCIKDHLKIALSTGGTTDSINFIRSKTPEYMCVITMNDPSELKVTSTYHITAEIEYTYEFKKELKIDVQPKL